ncbi:MAG: M48 family metalloprotease [Rhodospirillaceae bacterium]|nr:M48 family metalloprotease [Rhodospirillaceae bacterium]
MINSGSKLINRAVYVPLFVVALLGVGGCSANPATGEQSFTAFMSPEREKEVGREEHPKIIKAFGGVYDDHEIGAYVAGIGARLSQHSEMPELVWTFTVLNDSKINAFALPGGYVYITRGLLALASNEAEVAGVLSHEIGHVTARHTAQRYSTTIATSLGLQVLGAIGSAVGVPSVASDVAAVGAQAALQGYSRGQELQSDMLGVRYMTRGGYDPDAMTSFFTKLKAHQHIEGLMAGNPDAAEQTNIMATHPRTAERIEQAIKLASEAQNGTTNIRKKLNADEYLSQIDGMIFGDDPAQGLIRGNSFVHPVMKIRYDVPDGFRLFNSPANVVAKKNDEAVIVFDGADPKDVSKATSLKNYVTNYWATGIHVKGLENININGMNAVTGTSVINSKNTRRDVRLVAIQDPDGAVYRLLFITDQNKTAELNLPLRNTTYSFRKLTDAEAKSVKPYRIKLYNVRTNDTPASLSAMLKVNEFNEEWMEVLNAIKSDSKLVPGTTIKLISE